LNKATDICHFPEPLLQPITIQNYIKKFWKVFIMVDLTCFKADFILAGDALQVLKDQSLFVQSGRIIEVGNPRPSARQINLSGKLLCPMFINAHTHIGDTGAKELGVGLPLEQVFNPPDGLKHRFLNGIKTREIHIEMMRHGLLEMLRNGIIALADFREQGLEGIRSLRDASRGLPIRAIALGRMSETADLEQTEAEANQVLEEADGLGIRDVECYPMSLLVRLRANHPEKIFAAHAAENRFREMSSRTNTGKGQPARLAQCRPDFLVHLVYASIEELHLLADSGIRAVGCPRCNGILGDGLPRLADWLQSGLHFCLGTDNVMFNSPDMLREMDYASRMTRGLALDPAVIDSLAILKAATIEGAQALRLDADLGSLSAGKEASFIAFDLNSPNLKYQQDVVSAIVHRATPADISEIFIHGQQLNLADF
jgi:cytosine/adenosine deaminase-related metal-dependent hydrolase